VLLAGIAALHSPLVQVAMAADVSRIEQAGLIRKGWESRLPNKATPIHSTVAAFVRPGNPKKINSWQDLAKPNVDVVTANPKTSGGARWNFVALWGAVTQAGRPEAQARQFIRDVYKNLEVLPKDAREASDFFIKRKQGDVLLTAMAPARWRRRSPISSTHRRPRRCLWTTGSDLHD